MNRQPVYSVLALAVLFLSAVPVGIAVFVLGFVYGDSPCVMCWEQRIGMALIALAGLFILRYGPRPRYIGVAVLVGAWGVWMGIRHSSLHMARDIGQGFSLEILGAHTYTWSAFIFWVCTVVMGLLLMALHECGRPGERRDLRPLDSLAMGVFLLVIAGNIVQAFASTGPPPYMGQSDPVRFSFNPKYWVWSLEEWDTRIPLSWRGRWAIDTPALDDLDATPATGPLDGPAALTITGRQALALPLRGTLTDLAYDAASDRFLLTTQHGVYLADGGLGRLLKGTVVDPGYSVDLAVFAGAAFLDTRTLVAVAENKSFVTLKVVDTADAVKNFRYFLEAPDQFDDAGRGRFTTVRARLMYVQSAAFDPASNSLLTVGVPNARNRRTVVSRFARQDMTLSEEFVPAVAPGSGLTLKEGRGLEDYVVTGAAVEAGVLYALSAAHGTILSIDLSTRQVTAARTIAGLTRPVGLAIRGTQFVIAEAGGQVVFVNR